MTDHAELEEGEAYGDDIPPSTTPVSPSLTLVVVRVWCQGHCRVCGYCFFGIGRPTSWVSISGAQVPLDVLDYVNSARSCGLPRCPRQIKRHVAGNRGGR